MLISKPRQPQSMSLAEMVQSGLIPKVRELDLICKKCVDTGLEGLLFEDEQGELICPQHGPAGMFVSRIINEATPQFRGRYEYELTRRKQMNNQLMVQPQAPIQLAPDELHELMLQMFLSPAGIKKIIVRDSSGNISKEATQRLRRQAAMELAYLFIENDCDARKGEAYVFPTYDDGDKDKPDSKKSATGYTVGTGYKYHHRKAEDLGFQTIGRIDFAFGQDRLLTPDEMAARGVRMEETTCPKCDGKGKYSFYSRAEKKTIEIDPCYKCKGKGVLPPERVMGVEISLNILSLAKLSREAGLEYHPIKAVGYISMDTDTAWRGSDLYERALKRAKVACLRQYAPMRSYTGLAIGYSEGPGDIDLEAASDEYIEAAFTPMSGTPSPEVPEETEPQPEGEVESA